jgi:alanyl-tRNA synthetase
MKAKDILDKYIKFFEDRGHERIENSSLVPLNDPTTLFTSSGMQPLVSYLLGGPHPAGKRLVNVQNSFRAQDIDEIGDNRHTTFFRMLGNWSLGDYFKKNQIKWFFEFLAHDLRLDPNKLYVTVFEGDKEIPEDSESIEVWKEQFKRVGIEAEVGQRIFKYGVTKNWWSRAGVPENMPSGEPGGPDTEVFFELPIEHDKKFGKECHVNCDCGRYFEIGNSVFMQYQKTQDGFAELPQKNVDFGGGLERLVAATENKQDIFETSLFYPIIQTLENTTAKSYKENAGEIRIILDHFVASVFIISSGVKPSNKEQGYILRRLIRRGFDNFYALNGDTIAPIIEKIVEQYKDTDPDLQNKFEDIKLTILEEEQLYKRALQGGRKLIERELAKGKKIGDELMGSKEISADLAFKAITSFGLGPTQLTSLGYTFNEQALAEQIKKHQDLSRSGSKNKFSGGLADTSAQTIMGHTATHLMHQALRDMLGAGLHQTGSNITSERVRFDFSFDRKLTVQELEKLEETVNEKIQENLPVHFEMMPVAKAKALGAIGLFDEKYAKDVKVYFMGGKDKSSPTSQSSSVRPRTKDWYSAEFCGGPHVSFTGEVKRFKIRKQESLGRG